MIELRVKVHDLVIERDAGAEVTLSGKLYRYGVPNCHRLDQALYLFTGCRKLIRLD